MERKVGIVSILIGLFLMAFFLESFVFEPNTKNYNITIFFPFLESIYNGSFVKLNGGFPIGKVVGIETTEKGHIVHCQLLKKYPIPRDNSLFHIKTTGMIGSKYINILVSHNKKPYIQNGEHFIGIPPGNFNQSLQYFYEMFTDKPPPDDYNFAKLIEKSLTNIKNVNSYSKIFGVEFTKKLLTTQKYTKEFSNTLKILIETMKSNAILINNLDKKTFQNYQNTIDSFYNIIYKVSLTLYKGKTNHSEVIGKLLFEDTQYEKSLQFSEYINYLLEDFSMEPYKVLNN